MRRWGELLVSPPPIETQAHELEGRESGKAKLTFISAFRVMVGLPSFAPTICFPLGLERPADPDDDLDASLLHGAHDAPSLSALQESVSCLRTMWVIRKCLKSLDRTVRTDSRRTKRR